jgi:hypothetical protein
VLVLAGGCSKRLSPKVEPALAAVRADARSIAEAAAATCETEFSTGRFTVDLSGCSVNLLADETVVPEVPSPAKGTPLEKNPQVANVQVTCEAPIPGRTNEWCGSDLGPLRPLGRASTARSGPRKTAESTCGNSPTDCEEVVVPSHYAKDLDSADLRIVKPVVGGPRGATVEVTISLVKAGGH